MKTSKRIFILLSLYILFEQTKAKHVDLKFHPLTAEEVYEILKETNMTTVIPEGRIITQGIMAETKMLSPKRNRKARIFTLGGSSGESTTVLQEICFSSRSLGEEENSEEAAKPQSRQAAEPSPTTTTDQIPTGTPTGTPTGEPPTTICGFPITTTPPVPPITAEPPMAGPTPTARGLGVNKNDTDVESGEQKNSSKEKETPEGRQADPTTPTFTTVPGTSPPVPLTPPGSPPLTTTISCAPAFPAPAPPTATPTTTGSPGSPTTTATQPSTGGGINCIKLEKPIRR